MTACPNAAPWRPLSVRTGPVRTGLVRAGLAVLLACLAGLAGCGAGPDAPADGTGNTQAAADAATAGVAGTPPDSKATEAAPGPATAEQAAAPSAEASGEPAGGSPDGPGGSDEADVPPDGRDLVLLGDSIPPGTTRRLLWSAGAQFDGLTDGVPVYVANGAGSGPTLCITAAIHGDELNGIEMVRRVMQDLDTGKLKGAVIGIPIVNLQGFRRGSRYLPDRRDLNRFFPGNPSGSAASRIAHSLFDNVVRHCNGLVDIHTGSLSRTNLPQLRADLRNERVRQFADRFGGMVVLHSPGTPGTLRRAATDRGIPAVTLEAGEPGRLQSAQVRQGVDGVYRLLDGLGMMRKLHLLREPRPVYYRSTWVRADYGGIMFSLVRLGQLVAPGDILATITDPITNDQNLIYSPVRGRVLGMALNQVVMPGFATFNIGIETDATGNGSLMAALEPPPAADPAAPGDAAPDAINGEDRAEEDDRPE